MKFYNGHIPACGVFCRGCPICTREKSPCKGADLNSSRCDKCKTFTAIFCRSREKEKTLKFKDFRALLSFAIYFRGAYGTRTRDPMRDRHVF